MIGETETHPEYAQLKQRRNRLDLVLIVLMLAVYHGYIALIAFDKALLVKPVDTGVMSMGMPVGMTVIVFTVVVTGIHVHHANSEYGQLAQDILKDVVK